MPKNDFTNALAELLQNGGLRDLFRYDPKGAADRLGLDPETREIVMKLSPSNLEAQAEVLLRKRFEQVRPVLAETCSRLEDSGWWLFHAYSRIHWPGEGGGGAIDARNFCIHLRAIGHPVFPTEFSRLEFICGNTPVSLRFISDYPADGKPRPALQILLRHRRGWREWALVFRL